MPLPNPFRRQSERPSLRERATELRASLHASRPQQTPAPTAVKESAATADPIFAAIENHVTAREAFSAVCPGIDKDARREQGLDTSDEAMAPAQAAWDVGDKEEIAAWNAVFEARPTTLAGALAMVRHAQQWAPENYGMDGAILLKGIFGALAEGLAGAIEAEAAPGKLVRDILDGWAAWGAVVNKIDDSPEGTAAWDRSDAQRDRLLAAAMALPATPENITPKALACAWMEWVCTERPGDPRDAYGPADRLVYDIHASIMGRGVEARGDELETENAQVTVAAADWHASPVDLIATAGLSVRTLPVFDLCSMLDAAKILSDVAAAITCQPRQMTRGNYNGAGRLIEETASALHRAIDVVARELRRRTPSKKHEQACRLAALASLTIHNDDPAEAATFARELLAMVEP